MDVAKEIHQNHVIVLLSRCFVDVDHVYIEVHTFLFTSLFDVDVVNGIVNLQFSPLCFDSCIPWIILSTTNKYH